MSFDCFFGMFFGFGQTSIALLELLPRISGSFSVDAVARYTSVGDLRSMLKEASAVPLAAHAGGNSENADSLRQTSIGSIQHF